MEYVFHLILAISYFSAGTAYVGLVYVEMRTHMSTTAAPGLPVNPLAIADVPQQVAAHAVSLPDDS